MRLHTRVYALLLALHPADFRTRYAEEMALDFEDALHTFGVGALYRDALLSLVRQWSAPAPPVPAPSLLAGAYIELYQAGLSPFALTRGLFASTCFLSLCLFALQTRPLLATNPSAPSSPATRGHTGTGPRGNGTSSPDTGPSNPHSPGLVLPFYQANATPHNSVPRKVFEVASVRENKTDARPTMNISMGPGSYGYKPTGGYFRMTNLPVIAYIQFAYNLYGYKAGHLARQVPAWVKNTRYDIEARTDYPNPTKDDMRQMVRALLAERFHLTVHPETHDSPVLNLILAKPGRLGPSIAPHAPNDPDCTQNKPTTFFSPCGTIAVNPGTPDKMAGRKITMDDLTEFFPGFLEARPMVDKTGLTGTFDFTMDFVPEQRAQAQPDQPFPTFLQGLTEQLGLKVTAAHAPVEFYTFDHIDPLQEN